MHIVNVQPSIYLQLGLWEILKISLRECLPANSKMCGKLCLDFSLLCPNVRSKFVCILRQ